MGRLDGKVAVVTGGAGGIGEGAVAAFVREGARVVVADVRDDRGAALEAALGAAVLYRHTDVSKEADVQAAVAAARDHFGRLDCMFNNAGIGGPGGPIHKTELGSAYDAVLGVNLTGVILGMKHAAVLMREQRSGSIVTTSSIAGVQGGQGAHVYSAIKAGVLGLTRSVAGELAPFGVRVNAICPGAIATDILAPVFGPGGGGDVPERLRPFLRKFQPIPRAGEVDDVAQLAVFLASDESSFVTGQTLIVDGGATATSDAFTSLVAAIRSSDPPGDR